MLTLPTTYSAKLSGQSLSPIYVLEFAWNNGKGGTEGVNDLYIATHPVDEITGFPYPSRWLPLLVADSISALTERIDERNGVATIGSLSFSVLDKDQVFSKIMRRAEADTGQSLRRQRVELYVIFKGMDWADRVKIRTMQIYDMQYDGEKAIYDVSSQSILKALKKTLFVNYQTTLAAALGTADTTIQLVDATDFKEYTQHSAYNGGALVGFVKINDEIIMWAGKSGNNLTIATNGRGMFGTQIASHNQGDDVNEVAVMRGNPYMIALYLLLSQQGTGVHAYDVFPEHWSLGLEYDPVTGVSDVDIAQFQLVGQQLTGWDGTTLESGNEVELVFSSTIDGKALIEREILRNTGAFSRVLGDGRFSCKAFENMAFSAAVDPVTGGVDPNSVDRYLTMDDVVKWTPLRVNMQKYSPEMVIEFYPIPRDGTKFSRKAIFRDTAAKTRHGQAKAVQWKARGTLPDQASVENMFSYFNAVQARFSSPPYEMSLELLPKHHDIEVGDIVGIDLPIEDAVSTHKAWVANTNFDNGERIVTADNLIYVATPSVAGSQGGQTGATQPTWGADTVADGTIVWRKWDGHLSRAFEVTSTSLNVKTGNPTINVMVQPEVPTWWTPNVGATYRFADSAYQVGTDLSTLTGWTFNSLTGAVETTQNVTLAPGDYHYMGNIIIKHVVTISGTVRIFASGTITLDSNGSVDGRGGGKAGGVGKAPNRQTTTTGWWGSLNNTNGTGPGYIGRGGIGGNHRYYSVVMSHAGRPGKARHGRRVRINVKGKNQVGGQYTQIIGLPTALEGAGGGSGGSISYPLPDGSIGGNGGAGGAGLLLCARGADLTLGSIDLRGADGTAGTLGSAGQNGVAAGGGGGGGTLVVLVERAPNGLQTLLTNNSKILVAGGSPGNPVHQGWYSGIKARNGGQGHVITEVF